MTESFEEIPQIDPQAAQLAAQVLQAGQAIRLQEITNRRKLAAEADVAAAREGGTEALLAAEVIRLSDRMAWLHEHPMLSRFVGKSALTVTVEPRRRTRDVLSTQAITDGEIALLHGEHLMFSGIVFWRFYNKYEKHEQRIENHHRQALKGLGYIWGAQEEETTIYINQQVKDETTKAERSRFLYVLKSHESSTGMRVEVEDSAHKFSKYADKQRRALIAQVEEAANKDPRVYEDILPAMRPGISWEFPDEFFKEPLALVREANILLGTKNK